MAYLTGCRRGCHGPSVARFNRTIQILRSLNVITKASHLEAIERKQLAQIAKFDGHYLNMPKLLQRWGVRIEGPSA